MDRLTKGEKSKYVHCNIEDECSGQCGSCKRNIKIREKLKHYEDLEGQGMLIKLPCPVGTHIYRVITIIDYGEIGDRGKESYYTREDKFNLSDIEDFGKTVFLTQEEAEKKLRELKCKGGR